jgi:sugar lactone lactonase YvrE
MRFLGLLAGFLLIGPPEASAQQKPPEIRRTAVFRYEGGEKPLRSPLSLSRDGKSGELIVTSFEAGEVVILESSGALIKRIGRAEGLVTPYGVAIDPAGRILVSELRTGMLKVFSPGGMLEDEIDLSRLLDRTVSPGRIALDKDGRIYVADLSGNVILVLTAAGEFLSSVGTFDYLQKGVPAGGGSIVGLSARGTAVRVYDGNGTLTRSFGEHGDPSDRNISFPTGFAVDSKGRIWIADAFQHRLKIFSLAGEFLFNFGRLEETTDSGGFYFPVDLCFGEKGELFVLEKGADRIQVFQVDDLRK